MAVPTSTKKVGGGFVMTVGKNGIKWIKAISGKPEGRCKQQTKKLYLTMNVLCVFGDCSAQQFYKLGTGTTQILFQRIKNGYRGNGREKINAIQK